MKLPYLGTYNPMITQLRHRFNNITPNYLPVTSSPGPSSRFRFQQAAPTTLKSGGWQLQPLQMANAALTYEAYLSNPDAPVQRNGRCHSSEPYTWQDHITSMEQAEQAHHTHKQFSFAILSATQNKCLGCLHLAPLRPFLTRYNAPDHLLTISGENSAMVGYWLCRSHREPSFSGELLQTLHRWLSQCWELEGHLFRVDADDLTAVRALQAAGLQWRFSVEVAVRSNHYAFFGD